MALITKHYLFGANICDGCGKKNKNWMKKNFHNKKCSLKAMMKLAKIYNCNILNNLNNSNL